MKFYLILFILGFGLKSLIDIFSSTPTTETSTANQQETANASATQSQKRRPTQRKQPLSRPSAANNEHAREFIRATKELYGEEQETAISNLEDPQAILEFLLSQAGYNGLDTDESRLADDILESWYEKNPDAAIAFIEKQGSARDQTEFTHMIIRSNIKKDLPFENTLRLAQQHQHLLRDETGSIDLPDELYRAASTNPENLLLVCLLSDTRTNGPYPPKKVRGVVYPKDFDFETMLTKLSTHNQSLPNGEVVASVPHNLLSTWAQRDPNAAYNWLASEKHVVPDNDKMDDFLRGYKKVATQEDLGTFLADRINDPSNKNISYGMIGQALPDNMEKADKVIKKLNEHFPDQESKNKHLSGIVAELPSYKNGQLSALLSNMPRESHLDTIKHMDPSWHRGSLKSIYAKHGHSEQEIDEAIQTMRKPTREDVMKMQQREWERFR